MHILNEENYFKEYLNWKLQLARLSDVKNLYILDFSGFNSYTMEAVGLDNNHKLMQWFWEPAHYRVTLGNEMLLRLSGSKITFGRILNETTIKSVIEEDIAGLNNSSEEWERLKSQMKLN